MDEKIDRLVESCIRTETAVASLVAASSDHESRLRWLERLLSYGSGAGFALYIIVTQVPWS